MSFRPANILPAAVGAAAVAAFGAWLLAAPWTRQEPRLPTEIADGPSARDGASRVAIVEGTTIAGSGHPSQVAASWPCFRGQNRDGASSESVATDWGGKSPPVLWSADMGEGYAGAAIANGCAYVVDYDMKSQADAIRCLSLDNGAEIWRHSYPALVKRNHGMSRTIPAVTDTCALAMGPLCRVSCLDARDGRLLWTKDLVAEFGATVPQWYAGQCPLIDGGLAVLAPGGRDALLIGVDLQTGRVAWRAPNPHGWKMTHSSVLPTSVAGKRMYVYCGSGGVACVGEDGAILCETDEWRIAAATVPTPVDCGDGRLFFCGGYGAGGAMLQVRAEGDKFSLKTLWRTVPRVFGSEQQTPVLREGCLYGVLPRDAGKLSEQLACLDLDGRQLWTSGPGAKFGSGPYMFAGDVMLLMDDNGTLVAAKVAPGGYTELARAKVLEGHESWAPMALADGRLIVRDFKRMRCLDLRKP